MAPTFDRDAAAKNRMDQIEWLLGRYRHARELGYQLTDDSLEAMHSMEIELRRVIFKLKPPSDKEG